MKKIISLFCVVISCFSFTLFSVTKVTNAEEKYLIEDMLSYVWQGETSYKESVTVVEEQNGTILPISLLYSAKEILSIESATLETKYVAGRDYSLQDGKLIINTEGTIPRLTYKEVHPSVGQIESTKGGHILFMEGAWFHSRQIVVTYVHDAGYSEYIPESKGNLLPKTREILEKNEELNILVYGDSISTGANSSGHPDINVAPFLPIYPKLLQKGLTTKYQLSNINLMNESVGGTDSAWGLSKIRNNILNKYDDLDLIIIAFGMNDVTRDSESYAKNIKNMVNGLKSKYKNAEFILIAPMLPNKFAKGFYGKQPTFYEELLKLEKEGVAVANVTKVHEGILTRKKYADLTGNNVNHANDYLARIYAQTLLKTLEPKDDPVVEPPVGEDENTEKGCGSAIRFDGGALLLGMMSFLCIKIKKIKNKKEIL